MSNPVSASNAWAKIQKKITAQAGDASIDGTPEVQTPKATPAKKRAAKAVDGESPTKKTKTPSKAKKVKDEPVDEDGLSRSNSEVEVDGEAEKSFF
jgi:hypothetical protein